MDSPSSGLCSSSGCNRLIILCKASVAAGSKQHDQVNYEQILLHYANAAGMLTMLLVSTLVVRAAEKDVSKDDQPWYSSGIMSIY